MREERGHVARLHKTAQIRLATAGGVSAAPSPQRTAFIARPPRAVHTCPIVPPHHRPPSLEISTPSANIYLTLPSPSSPPPSPPLYPLSLSPPRAHHGSRAHLALRTRCAPRPHRPRPVLHAPVPAGLPDPPSRPSRHVGVPATGTFAHVPAGHHRARRRHLGAPFRTLRGQRARSAHLRADLAPAACRASRVVAPAPPQGKAATGHCVYRARTE